MFALKVTTIGSSAGLIMPKEVLARLKVKKGDVIYLTEGPGGTYQLTPYNPDFAKQMEAAGEIMAENRDVLRALAK